MRITELHVSDRIKLQDGELLITDQGVFLLKTSRRSTSKPAGDLICPTCKKPGFTARGLNLHQQQKHGKKPKKK